MTATHPPTDDVNGAPAGPHCRICAAPGCRAFTAREMMFGLRHEFEYLECPACGALQIRDVPANLGDYYPPEYYSFGGGADDGRLKHLLRGRRAARLRGGRTLAGRVLAGAWKLPELDPSIARAGLGYDDAVLDVGCGTGFLLRHMHSAGFTNLTGVDPYIAADIHYRSGIAIWKRTLAEMEGSFDFIMMVHSLEHIADPLDALRHVNRLLKPGHLALIRTPVADSYAWREYGVDWVQLDAPRHLVVHTTRGMRVLADAAGFELALTTRDSTAFQFWASEQYRAGIPLRDPRSIAERGAPGPAAAADMRAFAAAAALMNEAGTGDQACFYLLKR